MKKRLAVAFTGPSNSGKTTLIQKIATDLMPTHKVAIIKNDPKDKAQFDVAGKDSYKFSQTGAEVVVVSPARTTYFSQRQNELSDIIQMIGDFDILLVEGLKTLPLPRVAVFRNTINEDYLEFSEALAVDNSVDIDKYDIPKSVPVLDLNNTANIISWIEKNAKEV